MNRWLQAWQIVKDIWLTVLGSALILASALSARPSLRTMGVGLALTGVGASFHIGKLIHGHIDGRSLPSPSEQEPGASRSLPSPPEEGTDD